MTVDLKKKKHVGRVMYMINSSCRKLLFPSLHLLSIIGTTFSFNPDVICF